MEPARSGARDGSPPALSLWKKLLFSAVAVALFFGGLELVLLAAGVRPVLLDRDPYVGFSSQVPLFVEEVDEAGRRWMVTASNRLRFFNAQRFPADKPDGTYRVFCVGGSTTYGRPYRDATSFCGWLRELLPLADPSREWEVVNAGGISYASYRVTVVMQELARHEPDLFVIYSGHNEFLERRTYPELLDAPPSMVGLGALLSRTRTFAALQGALHLRDGEPVEAKTLLPGEVEALLDRSVGPSAYTRETLQRRQVLEHFELNLARMADIAAQAGATVLLVDPASNLRDASPFKSENREDLEGAALARWNELLDRGRQALVDRRPAAALEALDAARAIDDRHAGMHFLRGRALEALGRWDEAREAYRAARDEDICPLRAPSAVHDVVAALAAARDLPLVDFPGLVAARAEHGIPGQGQFLDHVHPTIAVNRALGRALVEGMAAEGLVTPGDGWTAEAIAGVAKRVEAGIDLREHSNALKNLSKVLGWAGKAEEARQAALAAARLLPGDAETHNNLGKLLQREGDPEGAAEAFRRALEAEPDDAEAHNNLADVLALLGRTDRAMEHVRRAIELRPDYAEAHNNLGVLLERRGEMDAAEAAYLRALELRPGFAQAHNNLGNVWLRRGDVERATERYRQAVEAEPGLAEAQTNLGNMLARQGRSEEAVERYRAAIRAQPDKAEAHNNLGVLLGQLGRLEQAAVHYQQALRLNPRYAQAHNNLGLLLARQGHIDRAEGHFERALEIDPGHEEARANLERLRASRR